MDKKKYKKNENSIKKKKEKKGKRKTKEGKKGKKISIWGEEKLDIEKKKNIFEYNI